MTKKDLIKKILELGKELEKADGFDAIMIVNDMEIEVDNYIKQLPIQNVVGQSEQFKCEKCGSDWGEVRATCFNCNHESEDLST